MENILLEVQDLTVGYGSRTILSGVTFSLRQGQVISLIGPNGSGKTTLLKTLARHLPALGGAVRLGEEDLFRLNHQTLARRLAILTTERFRGELMTCSDVVAAGRTPYTGRLGILSEEDRRKTEQAMALARVGDLADRLFDTLSDGQRQRTLLARALCQEPELLLLDEPTSFLDLGRKVDFLVTLRRLARERGIGVILSLHEPDCARRVSDQVLCLRQGRVDRLGPPTETLTNAYLEDLFDMERGSCAAFFGGGSDETFFQNRSCPAFPCHKGIPPEEFNCLFCYCPLYALGEACGGGFSYTDRGVKSCVNCTYPHRRENYSQVLARWPEIAALAGRKDHG